MDRERLDDWLEKAILGLITLILVLAPALFASTPLRFEMLISGLTCLALVCWLVRFWVRDEYRILWPPFAWAVVAFVGYVIWRYTAARVEYLARVDMNRVILYAAIFFLVLDNLNRQEWTQSLVYTLIFVGMAASMYAVFQYLTQNHKIYNTPQPLMYYGRAGGPFICPNHLAGYLAMTLPLAFAVTLMARVKILTKVFLCYAGIVMLAGLVATVSRGGIAAAAVGLLALFTALVFNRDFRLPAIVAIVLIVVPAIWLGSHSFRLQARLAKATEGPGFNDDRLNVWPVARQIWQEHFWTGAGPGQFDMHFRALRPPLNQLQVRPYRVHNDYLNMLVDYGLAGLAIVMAAWGVFWIGVARIWKFVRRANDFGKRQSTRAAIVLGGSAGLGALMAQCVVDFDLYIPALGIAAATLLAIVSGHWRFATERFWVKPGIAGRLLASVICLAAIGWMGSQVARLGREGIYLAKAEKAKDTPAEFGLLKKAYAVEPKNPETNYRIGELLRKQSWNALGDYRKLAEEAIGWFDRAIDLDPTDAHGYLGKGMCLHWLERPKEAWEPFRQAMLADPNSYFTRAHYGWHFFQLGAWDRAWWWFHRSLSLRPDNPIALSYIKMTVQKAEEEKAKKATETPK